MALNIKDAETDRLARELADLTGQPITAAVREALEEKLAGVHALRRSLARDDVMREIVGRGRARSTIDGRSADEILGYDDQGLPA